MCGEAASFSTAFFTGVAQLVEHWSPKPGVGRSSRSSRAISSAKMKLLAYFREVYDELLHKVSWPTWKELQSSAMIVMIASLLIALVVFVMDFSFEHVMDWLYRMLY